MRRTHALLVGVLTLALAGCSTAPERTPTAQPSASPSQPVPARLAVRTHDPEIEPRQVLALVPASVETLTISNFGETRDRADAPSFTEGLFAGHASLLRIDYGFTQDDVDWEARFSGPDGAGFVLSFRPGQDMAEIRRAVADRAGPLTPQARVLASQHLLVAGIASDGEPVLASDPRIPPLLEADAEAAYLRTACVPLDTALGRDAGEEQQERLFDRFDISNLDPLGPFVLNFHDGVVTGRVEPDRIDLHDRTDLIDRWPRTRNGVEWDDGFEGLPVADPSTGRIGLQVRDPAAAVSVVLAEHLPFAVCDELTGP